MKPFAKIGLAAVAALLVIGGGVAVYRLNVGVPASSDTHIAAVEPPHPPPSSPAPPPSFVPMPTFKPFIANFMFAHDTTVYVEPSDNAPVMYVLPAGTPFVSFGKSNDGRWIAAMTANDRAANIQAADVVDYDPSKMEALESTSKIATPDISGTAEVIDTATLSVDGHQIALFGILGRGGEAADRLRKSFIERSAHVSCKPHGNAYICNYANGDDIARVELYGGTAEPGPDAGQDYKHLADLAHEQRKGIWR